MIKLGVNTVLFKEFSFAEACAAIARAGYDGVEISAIAGMCEHLSPDNWRSQTADIRAALEATGMELLSCELASLDPVRLEKTCEAAAAIGLPIVNIGPGGKSDVPGDLEAATLRLQTLAEIARPYGVTLCCKAHVGAAVYNTPTTLAVMANVSSPAFGVDMDPSHIYRAGEDPAAALAPVLSRTKHVHIRDCKGPGPSPGTPALQACGRGDIDLWAYFRAMTAGNYNGPVCLEVIGPAQTMAEACTIAAESYGYMNAILRALGAR